MVLFTDMKSFSLYDNESLLLGRICNKNYNLVSSKTTIEQKLTTSRVNHILLTIVCSILDSGWCHKMNIMKEF